jgi:hypothetical protein
MGLLVNFEVAALDGTSLTGKEHPGTSFAVEGLICGQQTISVGLGRSIPSKYMGGVDESHRSG